MEDGRASWLSVSAGGDRERRRGTGSVKLSVVHKSGWEPKIEHVHRLGGENLLGVVVDMSGG